jgi:hypothetical protein
MYVIERTDQGGGYVAMPGSRGSYTQDICNARTFATEEEARAECCPDNERPVRLNQPVPGKTIREGVSG